jgi:hypothetical protein
MPSVGIYRSKVMSKNMVSPFGPGWRQLNEVVRAAGFTVVTAKEAKERYGLRSAMYPAKSGEGNWYWVREDEAAEWIKLVTAQRADGRCYGFGPSAAPPGESTAARAAARAAAKATAEATVRPEPVTEESVEEAPVMETQPLGYETIADRLTRVEAGVLGAIERQNASMVVLGAALARLASAVESIAFDLGVKVPPINGTAHGGDTCAH